MSMYTQLVRDFFPYVEKPGRYSGGELNAQRKNIDDIDLVGVLCFPELYDIGMSHYGSQILYHIVNKQTNWALGRCYMPWLDAEKVLREKDIPLYSLEYFTPIKEADWLGFSMQYELQYANVINMLDLAQLPLYAKERTEEHPIIIAGGPSMANPEPLADIFDIILPGDGEEALVQCCEILEKSKAKGLSREETLQACRAIPTAYIPHLYATEVENGWVLPVITETTPRIPQAKVSEFTEENTPREQIVPLVDVVHHRMAIEVMRGCTRGCRFCAAGYYDRPVREKPIPRIAQQIHDGMAKTGWEDVSLLSLSTADYTQFSDLLCAIGDEVSESDLKVALPSTRIDAITENEFRLLDQISPGSSLTIAPEAGSQRLRNVINKDFTRETIIAMIHELMKNSHNTIKLYFMVGLPTETEKDIDELIDLVAEIAKIAWADSHRRNINVGVSPFAPKPHTPFQWEELCSQETLISRCKRIKATLRKHRNVKVDYRDSRMARIETVLNRGDRALTPVIVEAWRSGTRFDGWNDYFKESFWFEAAEKCGVELEHYTKEIPTSQRLPWDAIEMGYSTDFLLRERDEAYAETTIDDCRNECHACGICNDTLDMLYTKPTGEDVSQVEEKLTAAKEKRLAGERSFFRVHYTKGEEIRFLSHRNVVDIITRACKAAKIPVALTEGYKPHPKLSFGPPLPLGAIGASELFDLALIDQTTFDVALLSPFLPIGLTVNNATLLTKKPRALNAEILAGDWSITPLVDLEESYLAERVETFLAGTKFTVLRTSKKGVEKEVNIRPLVYDLLLEEKRLTCRLSMIPGETCRPMDLIAVLFPENAQWDFAVNRKACLQGEKESLQQL